MGMYVLAIQLFFISFPAGIIFFFKKKERERGGALPISAMLYSGFHSGGQVSSIQSLIPFELRCRDCNLLRIQSVACGTRCSSGLCVLRHCWRGRR